MQYPYPPLVWSPKDLIPTHFKCGYCGVLMSSHKGFESKFQLNAQASPYSMYICSHCYKPSFLKFASNGLMEEQYPGVSFGNMVGHITNPLVEKLYDEARKCMSVNAYTSVAMACRKLLMQVAVDLEAEENKTFAYYVDYLAEKNYVPYGAKEYLTHIRTKGNDANHKIEATTKTDAESLLTFSELLLKNIYEVAGNLKKALNVQAEPESKTVVLPVSS